MEREVREGGWDSWNGPKLVFGLGYLSHAWMTRKEGVSGALCSCLTRRRGDDRAGTRKSTLPLPHPWPLGCFSREPSSPSCQPLFLSVSFIIHKERERGQVGKSVWAALVWGFGPLEQQQESVQARICLSRPNTLHPFFYRPTQNTKQQQQQQNAQRRNLAPSSAPA